MGSAFQTQRAVCRCMTLSVLIVALLCTSQSKLIGDSPSNAGARPKISYFSAEIYSGYVMVTGTVTDADDDPVWSQVQLWGTATGIAWVGPDGHFTAYLPESSPYGTIYGRTTDVNGNSSNVAIAEFYE